MGLPLLFRLDVIHGYRTVYPLALAEAGTFNPDLMKKTARMAARESHSGGVAWHFAPMVDIARDARWGRVSEGGRDYNTVNMAMSLFYNVYLRPFQAAVRSGAQTAMAAFNDLNGVPCTVNKFLLREVLKDTLGLPGFVVSDANAIKECVSHGIAADDDAVRQLPGHDRPVPGVLQPPQHRQAGIVRPVKELKGFAKVRYEADKGMWGSIWGSMAWYDGQELPEPASMAQVQKDRFNVYVERRDENGPLCHANSEMLEALIPFNGIEVRCNTTVKAVEPGKAILGSQDGESPADADSVILCVGYRAEKSLYEACKNKLPEVRLIGDANNVSNIMYAIWDAYEVASTL